MAEDLFCFKKMLLESAELEASLMYTLKKFSIATLTEKEMLLIRTKCSETVCCIRKAVQIRQVLSKSTNKAGTLDERGAHVIANKAYAKLSLVRYDPVNKRYISPSLTNDQVITYDMAIERKYEEAFRSFFEKHHYLVERYRFNVSGWLCNNINAELSTDEYCKVIISEMTAKWARRLLHIPAKDDNYDMELRHDFLNGYKAVTARWAMGMIAGYNLFQDVEKWAKNIKIVISLSTYLTVLDSVFHKRGTCGHYLIRDTYKLD